MLTAVEATIQAIGVYPFWWFSGTFRARVRERFPKSGCHIRYQRAISATTCRMERLARNMPESRFGRLRPAQNNNDTPIGLQSLRSTVRAVIFVRWP